MIDKEHIIFLLKKDKELLRHKLGVKNLALFGSYANNFQREDSDIDFLIELYEISYKNLFETYSFFPLPIIDFRNIILHEYEVLDYEIIYKLCTDDLLILKQKIQTYLSSTNETV